MRLFFSLLCSFVFFCASSQAEFRFRLNEDLGSLDWGNGEINGPVVQQLMEGLTLSGPKGEALPAIAASWKKRGRVFEFNLRSGAKWSDGETVCAKHFVDAWRRALSPEFASPYAHYFFEIKNASRFHAGELKKPTAVGVRAQGCNKLVVELERDAAYFPALVSHWVFYPIRLDLLKKYGKAWTKPENLAVTGPYALSEWKRDQKYALKRNPRYYGTPAHEENLVALVITDDSTARNLFEQGKLDWMKDVPFLDKPELSKRPEYRLFPSYVSYFLGFRFGAGATLTRDQRCALARGIDKSKIPALLKGGEQPASSVAPSSLTALNRASSFDVRISRPLLAKAKPGPLQIHFYSKDVHQPLVEMIQEQWRKYLGLEVELVKSEGKTYWSRLQKDPPQIFLSGTTAAFAHPFAFYSEFLSASHANWGRYDSKTYDAAALGTISKTGEALTRASARAEGQILDHDCAIIPLYFRQSAALVSTKWQGFIQNPMTYVYLKDVRAESKSRK